MNWMLLLYNTLVVVVALDALASLIASAYMFKLRQRFGLYLALMFAGVAACAGCCARTSSARCTPTSGTAAPPSSAGTATR